MIAVAAALEFSEQQELADAPEELRLTEAASVVPASARDAILGRAQAKGITLREGEELLQIIRPTIGGGRGTRYYSPQVLEADAKNWAGVRMFRNHLTDKQREALEGLPRPIEHLAGRILESWWDGEVPADDRFEQGGVYARVKPRRDIREALDDDPDLMDTSISALATSIRPGTMNGRRVAIVEGIRIKPRTVDWVSEGGAGGRALREAAEQEEAVLESMTDEEFRTYMEQERPELLEALKGDDPDNDNDDDTAEINQRAAKHVKAGKSRKQAVALARQEIAASKNETQEGAEMADAITPEALREAFASDEGKAVLLSLVEEVAPSTDGFVKADEVDQLVESRMAERADLIRIEARGDLERQIELRDMRDKAAELVQEAKLHPKLAARITETYTLTETGEPTAALAAIKSDFDDDGNVVKSGADKLVEAVNSEIEDARAIQGDLRPTRVKGAGSDTRLRESRSKGTDEDADEDKDAKREKRETTAKSTGSALADELLEGSGFSSESLGSLWANGL